MASKLRLVGVGGRLDKRTWDLSGWKFFNIGGSSKRRIVVRGAEPKHARIEKSDDAFYVVPVDGRVIVRFSERVRKGTILHTKRTVRKGGRFPNHKLWHGMLLQIGNQVFRIEQYDPQKPAEIHIRKEPTPPKPRGKIVRVLKPEAPIMIDAYDVINEAVSKNVLPQLLFYWGAHSNLRFWRSPQKLEITAPALEQLRQILEYAHSIRREVSVYFVEKNNRVHYVVPGHIGEHSSVMVHAFGDANGRALQEAQRIGGRLGIGHIHLYAGPIFSRGQSESHHYAGTDHYTHAYLSNFAHVSPYHVVLAKDPISQKPALGVWSAQHPNHAIVHKWSAVAG